jgi:hypothetical protein
MIETAANIRKGIRKLWPNAVFLRTPDEQYYVPSKKEIYEAVDALPVLTPPTWDGICNWWALQAYADIQLDKLHAEAPWAFGIADGNKFRGFPSQHTLNIAYTRDGIYLIDIHNHKRWLGSATDDYILTVSM